MSLFEDDISKILNKILPENDRKGFHFDWSCNENGKGYMGDIIFVNVKITQKITYNFVLKCEKNNNELKKIMPVQEAFSNEVFVYTTVFPEFFKHSPEDSSFQSLPKCWTNLLYNGNQIIVLENLKIHKYEMWDSHKPLDVDHINLVMGELGKFHAYSLALREKDPGNFRKIQENLDDVFRKIHKADNTIYGKISKGIYDFLKRKKGGKMLEKAQELFNNFLLNLEEIGDPNSPFSVVVHGDCWLNNILFKYDNNNKPFKVALLDWQLAKVASPVTDLSFFLYSSCSQEQLEHFDQFLQTYYENLTGFLGKMCRNPEKIITLNDLKKEWRKYGKYGVVMMPILLMFCLCPQNQTFDSVEVVGKDKKIEDELFDKLQDEDVYFERIFQVLEHFFNKWSN